MTMNIQPSFLDEIEDSCKAALLVHTSPISAERAKEVQALRERLEKKGIVLHDRFSESIESDSLDAAIIINNSTSIEEVQSKLPKCASILKPGGRMILQMIISKENGYEDLKSHNEVIMLLMMSGFVDSQATVLSTNAKDSISVEALQPVIKTYDSEKVDMVQIFSSKPDFSSAPSASLKLPSKSGTSAKVNTSNSTWHVVADNFDEDEIDEDDLLEEEEEVVRSKAKDDCEVGKNGKRRACKDCTCGRKDMDDKPVVSNAELKEMVSSCGNCFKGDAFRCGSCPYLGQPAFKPGMGKVVLDLDGQDDF